ncbi:MAG TPA: hypothetical protein VHY35_08945 [Stellaceae bacterium]|jgi:transposase-like protein|nr:hypothetical protein [Stellaceae bacterium]
MSQAIKGRGYRGTGARYSSPEDLLGEEGVFKELKKRLLERAVSAELSEHLGYEKGDPAGVWHTPANPNPNRRETEISGRLRKSG